MSENQNSRATDLILGLLQWSSGLPLQGVWIQSLVREPRSLMLHGAARKKKSTGLPGGTHGKEPPSNAGDVRDTGLTPGSARSPGGEHGNPLQYSCLENPMDRGAWQATVHRAAKSQTQLK